MSTRASASAAALACWVGACTGPPPIVSPGTGSTSKPTDDATASSTDDATASSSDDTTTSEAAEATSNASSTSRGISEDDSTASSGETAGDETLASSSTSTTSPEPELPEDPALWLSADHGVELLDDRVTSMQDRSGLGHHATQAESAWLPRFVTSTDGLPMVEFDGQDDALRLPTGFGTFQGASFFAVVEPLPHSGCAGILSLSNGDDTDDIEFGRHEENLLYYEVLGEFVEGSPGAFETDRRFLASIVQNAGGATILKLDAALTGSGTIILPAAVTRTENYVGKNTYDECPTSFHGRLGELLLYTRALAPEEQSQIESYLASRWNLAL